MNENQELDAITAEQNTQAADIPAENPVAQELSVMETPVEAVPVEAAPAPTYEATPVQYNSGYEVAAAPQKKSLVPLFICIGAGVVLIAALTVGLLNYNYIYAKLSPEKYSLRAAEKTVKIIDDRRETTPFAVADDVEKALLDGTVAIEGKIEDTENDISASAKLSLSRDTEIKENLLKAEVGYSGLSATFDVFTNDKRAAFTSSLFENNQAYGIDYENAIQRINDKYELDLDEEEIEMMQKSLDGTAASADFDITKYDKSFLSLRDKFLEIMKADVSYEDIELNGETVKCIAVKYSIDETQLVALLKEYREIVKNDEDIKEAIELYPSYFNLSYPSTSYYDDEEDENTSAYDSYLESLELLIEDIEENYEGTINISLYSNKKGALVKVQVDGNGSYYDEQSAEWDDEYEADKIFYLSSLDLGKDPSASKEYRYEFSFGEDETNFADENKITMVLSEETNNESEYKGTLFMSTTSYSEYMEKYDTEETSTDFEWDKSTKEYTLIYNNDRTNPYSDSDEHSVTQTRLSGEFTRSDDGNVIITVDDIVYTDEYTDEDDSANTAMSYELIFTATQGADIEPLEDYKEFDDWTDEDTEGMMNSIQEFVMKAVLGDSYDDYNNYYSDYSDDDYYYDDDYSDDYYDDTYTDDYYYDDTDFDF